MVVLVTPDASHSHLLQGLESLAFKEHADYEAVASTNPDFNRAIVRAQRQLQVLWGLNNTVPRSHPPPPCQVRVNIFRGHRQTIQYIEAHDAEKLAQAELVVIDEVGRT